VPEIYQVCLDSYNEWCQNAYDWVAICNHLEEIDFLQTAIWGFEYRGPHDLFVHDTSQYSNSIEAEFFQPDSDAIASPSQIAETEDEETFSEIFLRNLQHRPSSQGFPI
jgi:hypothetical protein